MFTQAPSQKNHPETPYPIECPKCHQRSIVQHGESVYVCLSCDFRKDVSQTTKPQEAEFNPFLAILIAIVITLLLI
jgi:ribosomal protein L37AE/L43A